jgi:hypothetical protein
MRPRAAIRSALVSHRSAARQLRGAARGLRVSRARLTAARGHHLAAGRKLSAGLRPGRPMGLRSGLARRFR